MPAQSDDKIYVERQGIGGWLTAQQIADLFGIDSYFEQIIWAEENGGTSTNSEEWSFGNGSTGSLIGIPSFWDCQAVGMVFNAETVGRSLQIHLKVNGVNVNSITSTTRDEVVDFITPINIYRKDRISFRTGVDVGNWSDVRVGVVLRIPIVKS